MLQFDTFSAFFKHKYFEKIRVMTVSIERTKELLNDPAITDEEAMEIRDGFRALAEVIFEQWQQIERSKNRKPVEQPQEKTATTAK